MAGSCCDCIPDVFGRIVVEGLMPWETRVSNARNIDLFRGK